ncbi:TonB-dependent receptor [Pseudomaricurvus sp. HS19]|uniref:TonB-dependent receptor n=1 Tax=Pseudomaricurvus sp. HS19 TaxID=2692626 RepID=UPI001369CB0C|nr:TonB-dependent receptor [Pseudomaricurvus sp. HS19]MYM64243.1 TonB-dependent receptor [Pseudomaricurvus sp. HS19]
MKTTKSVLATTIAILASSNVLAQPTSTPVIEEVLVTAQKRTERLLDVPMSITAVTAAELSDAGIGSTGDLQQIVPGLTTVNNGLGFVPVIRGVSSQGTSPGDESNVSIYLDDVYLGAPMAGLFDLADIERVEVLKGPQGTLFGRNATGGAIRIVTRKPAFEPQANASVDYGFDYNEWKTSLFVTGPLSEKVAASLSGTYRSSDGYIDGIGPNEGREYGDPDNHLIRGKLLFQATDNLEMTLAADTMKAKNDTIATVWPPKGSDPIPGAIPSQPFKYAGSTQPKQDLEGKSVSLDATWNSDAVTVRSITAYRDMDLEYQADVDRSSAPGFALNLTQYQENLSQEFNFSGATGSINWLAGLYYYDSEAGNPHWTVFSGDAPDGTKVSSFTSQVDTSSYAGFGEVTWDTTDKLHFTLGARYTSETKEFRYRTLLNNSVNLKDKETWTSPTYRGVVRYDLSDDSNVYLSLSNGFKSGVYDAYSSLGIPVDPEEVDALEIGAKTRVRGITLTAAAYAYEYDDIQVSSFATVNNVVVLSLTNAASAEMRGLELTADGPITDSLSFNFGVNWAETAEFKEFENAQVTQPISGATGPVVAQVVAPYDASGSRIPRTPEWTANLGFTHVMPLFDGELSSNVSAFFSPGFYWQVGDYTKEPSYETVAARISWTDPSGRLTYSLWGTNLTDSDNSVYRVPNVRGDSSVATQGRQIGIGVALDF